MGLLSYIQSITFWGVIRMVAKLGFGLSLLFVGFTLCGIWFMQEKAIYPAQYPEGSRETVDKPDKHGLAFTEPELTTPDGVKLKTYLMTAQGVDFKRRPTVIYFHANAGNMGHRLQVAKVFVSQLKLNCLMLSYRGYGLSEGSPNEKGIKLDAQTALDFVTNHNELSKTPIIFYGQSLGGAVAINLAADNPEVPAAVIVENTFLDMPSLVPHFVKPLAFLTFLLHQIWPSADRLATVPGDLPMLFLSGGKDEIVPKQQMADLFKIAQRRSHGWGKGNSQFKLFPNGTHNDTVAQKGYFEEVHSFLENKVMKTAGGSRAVGRGARFLERERKEKKEATFAAGEM